MRILTVEDDPLTRRVMIAVLEQLGHSVVTAGDGIAGWEQFELDQADVVITDWMMPRLDGLELVKRIRAAARERYTWIIMLTALSGRDRYHDGMEAGVDDFMVKPVDRGELQARLRVAQRVLGLQRTVSHLEGLLPICSYCKRIRDEAHTWCQVEDYVSRRTEATFSHGVCPECYETHLKPQLDRVGQHIQGGIP